MVVRLIDALREFNGSTENAQRKDLEQEILKLAKPLTRLRIKLIPKESTERGYERYYLRQEPLTKWNDNSNLALAAVMRLSFDGLQLLRLCPCRRWFMAYNSRNRFHTLVCKRSFETNQRKTPEGRESRRLYMRTLRATKKSRKQKRMKR